jgi:hypothetical protein
MWRWKQICNKFLEIQAEHVKMETDWQGFRNLRKTGEEDGKRFAKDAAKIGA